MLFVTIEKKLLDGKDYIRFCNHKECITIQLVNRNMISVPFPGGRIEEEYIGDLINFLKECDMPLVKGKRAKTKKGFSKNVKTEIESGKPPKQAIAIA